MRADPQGVKPLMLHCPTYAFRAGGVNVTTYDPAPRPTDNVIFLFRKKVLPYFVTRYKCGWADDCHRLAFEFAYDVISFTIYAGQPANRSAAWHWCMGRRGIMPAGDTHSWIEDTRCGEAFDVVGVGERCEIGQVLIQPIDEFRRDRQITDAQTVDFYEVYRWLQSPKRSRLFPRYRTVSDAFSTIKPEIQQRGLV